MTPKRRLFMLAGVALVGATAVACGGGGPAGVSPASDEVSAAPPRVAPHHAAPHQRPPAGVPPPGAEPEFAVICEESVRSADPYFGMARIPGLEQAWAARRQATDTRDAVRVGALLSQEYLQAGRLEEAVAVVEAALARAAELPPTTGLRLGLLMHAATIHLRRGEQRNCFLDYSAESCILPFGPRALHRDPGGSRAAIPLLEEVLGARPQDAVARYLLNLAHMTLGSWPAGVPEAWLIPPTRFASDGVVGHFENIAPAAGVDVWSLAGGAILEDLTGDGRLDILASAMDPCAPLRLFRNEGGSRFSDISEAAGVIPQLGGLNLVSGDYDNDGDVDVLVLRGGWQGGSPLGRARRSLLRNRGDGTFEDVTRAAGVEAPHWPSQSAAFADHDLDGDLDLFVCTEGMSGGMGARGSASPSLLFDNQGDGTFRERAGEAGVTNDRFCKGAAWGDIDNDGDPDLYVSNFQSGNRLFRNEGGGRFTEVAGAGGAVGPMGSFPVWFFDYDNDGHLDLFAGAFAPDPRPLMAEYAGVPGGGETSRLYRGLGGGRFEDVTATAGLQRSGMAMGGNFGDLDGDGWLDIYLGVGSPNFEALLPNPAFRNEQGVRFSSVTAVSGLGHLQKGHGIAFGDVDEDGDQDLYVELGGAFTDDAYGNALFRNPGHGTVAVQLLLEGVRSNRRGQGARLVVTARGPEGRREIHRVLGSGGSFGAGPLRAEIGLGPPGTVIESVAVRWPIGTPVELFRGVEPGRAWRLREGSGRAEPLAQ